MRMIFGQKPFRVSLTIEQDGVDVTVQSWSPDGTPQEPETNAYLWATFTEQKRFHADMTRLLTEAGVDDPHMAEKVCDFIDDYHRS